MRISLQVKAITVISVMAVVLSFSLMAISVYHGGRSIREELLRRGELLTNNLSYNATYSTLIGDTTALADLLNGVVEQREVLYARIVERAGYILVMRQRAEWEANSDVRPNIDPTLDTQTNYATTTTEDVQLGSVHFQAPIVLRTQLEQDPLTMGLYDLTNETSKSNEIIGYVQIGMTTRYIEDSIAAMRSNMAWITLLVVLCAMLITSIIVRLSIRPINELVNATGRVAAGDYDVKVKGQRNDEIGDLAASFNMMTADLKSSREALVEKELLEEAIVELKDTQQQLVQAGKMAAIGQLAAGVAHEINNPLAGIMGYAQLASEQLRAREDRGVTVDEMSKFLGYVSNMEKQSQRCKQIVQNLLRFARASSRDELEAVDVNNALTETLSFMAHQFETMQIDVRSTLADDLPLTKGQPGKLQQVFTNILINAVQAMCDGGRIDVSTRLDNHWIRVHIRDTGEGIPKENLEKIFEPFFTTKEIGQGTGLGLSVTYGLIRDMGGSIEVESTVGSGTTFTVSMPVISIDDQLFDKSDKSSLRTQKPEHIRGSR